MIAGGTLDIDLLQLAAYVDTGIVVDASIEDVRILDTGAQFAAMEVSLIARLADFDITSLNATDDKVALTFAQIEAIDAIGASFDTGDVVTLAVTTATLGTLSAGDLAKAAAFGVTTIASISVTVDASAATLALLRAAGLSFEADLTAHLVDTAANLVAISAADLTAYTALGLDALRLFDSATAIAALTSANIAALDAMGVSTIAVTGGSVTVSLAKALQFASLGMVFDTSDSVIVSASSSTFADPDTFDLTGLQSIHIDQIDASDNTLTLSLAAAQSYVNASIGFVAADAVTVKLSYAEAKAFAEATGDALHAAGVDRVEIDMTAAELEGLTYTELTAFIAAGIDGITGLTAVTFANLTYDLDTHTANYNPVITSNGGGVSAAIAIAENNTAVTTLRATDQNTGTTLTYSIIGGADRALFTINARTGALVFKAASDFETPKDSGGNNVYDLIVQVSDGKLTDTQSLHVSVQNVNEAPSVPVLAGTVVKENIASGTLVGTFSTKDPEGKALSYRLLDSADGLFKLSGAKLVTAKTIDYEKVQKDMVTVEVSDGVHKVTKTFTITVTDILETISGTAKGEVLKGGIGMDRLMGLAGNDTLYGYADSDTLAGGDGNDVLVGGAGTDRLVGGLGFDDLYGGAGGDRFVFTSIIDLGTSTTATDSIFDFAQEDRDLINLAAIDANLKKAGGQAFSFIGTAAFSGTAGELRYEKTRADTYVYGDIDGNGQADFILHIDAVISLKAGDFLL